MKTSTKVASIVVTVFCVGMAIALAVLGWKTRNDPFPEKPAVKR